MKPGRRYAFGRELEYAIRDELRSYEYFVLRSSHSETPVDLVALRKGEVLLIQCKRDGILAPKGWNALWAIAEDNHALALLARKQPKTNIGNLYWRLTGGKIPHQRNPPMEVWHPTAPGQGVMNFRRNDGPL